MSVGIYFRLHVVDESANKVRNRALSLRHRFPWHRPIVFYRWFRWFHRVQI